MARLRQRDLQAVLDAVETARGLADAAAFPEAALAATRSLVRADVASFNEVDPEADRIVAVVDPHDYVVGEAELEALGRLQGEHPLIRHLHETGDGSAVKLSDFVTLEQLHGLEIYRQAYGPLGVEHQMSITLPAPRPRIVAIALSRASGDFDERDRALLNALRPHLAQSYRLLQERDRLRAALGALAGALRERGGYVVALGPEPHELTAGAVELLRRYFGEPGGRWGLPAPVVRWLETQRASEHTLSLLQPLSAEEGPTRLVVRYLPEPEGPGLLLLDERAHFPALADLQLLGLTAREADVLQLVAQGATDGEIATTLGIAPGTVRKHLDNLYRKLGVHRRTQAVALALELLTPRTTEETTSAVFARRR